MSSYIVHIILNICQPYRPYLHTLPVSSVTLPVSSVVDKQLNLLCYPIMPTVSF